jgi:hypothetical protein
MNMKIYRKYLMLGLAFVLIGASLSIGATSQSFNVSSEKHNSTFGGRGWSDDFSAYMNGQFLDGGPDDGGWKGWDDDPTFGAYVVDYQELSVPHSVEIVGDSDLIHEYNGYIFGQWNYTAWVYVPSDFIGNSYFMILSDYEDGQGADNKWQFVMRFDADNQIVESENDGNSLILKTDQWVEIRVEIDLDTDWFQLYYDADLLVEREWTAGWDGAYDGFLVIDAVDLFASGASEIYYDDMSLTGDSPIPAICCQGDLSWSGVKPGESMSDTFEVSNCGDTGSELDWEVSEWPTWGSDWIFNPASGTGLTPAQGWQTVTVDFTAPTQQEQEFLGNITVINSNDPSDFCKIPIFLQTPRNKQNIKNPLLNFLENHPNMFPIIRQLLGL